MIDKITEASLLYDFYGQLLTKRKQQVMELYHEENLSLAEIAEEFGISRAAVHDSLKSAEKSLAEYEEKLGLVSRFVATEEAVRTAGQMLDQLEAELGGALESHPGLSARLQDIRKIISSLEEA